MKGRTGGGRRPKSARAASISVAGALARLFFSKGRSRRRIFALVGLSVAVLIPAFVVVSGEFGSDHVGAVAQTSGSSQESQSSLAAEWPAQQIVWPVRVHSDGNNLTLVTPNCDLPPSRRQERAALALLHETQAAATRFRNIAVAKADGFRQFGSANIIAHYINWKYVNHDPRALDPAAIQSLIYVNLLKGPVLVGVMYMMRDDQVHVQPPMPGGCVMEWHRHTNMCFSRKTGIGIQLAFRDVQGRLTCPAGMVSHPSQPMIHVWLAPMDGDPFAVNVTDPQIFAAAAELSKHQTS